MSKWEHHRLLRENAAVTPHQEHSEALFLTSSFTFRTAAEAAEKFAQTGADYIYSRFSNPTVATFNRRMAIMEGAEFSLSTASGMAAILSTVMGVCKSGDRVLCAADVFGATVQLLSAHLSKFGVNVTFIDAADTDGWRREAAMGAALLLVETPSNPMQQVADLAALADIAHNAGALLAVDNCFCAGAQQPLQWGADIVIHSGTKYLDGQGRVLGGVIVGKKELLMEKIYPFLRAGGPAMSPFNAWVLAKSLETLPLRVRAHSAAALDIAAWLQQQPGVEQIWHTALPSHPAHALAMRQQNNLGGGLIAICLKGGKAAAWRFIDALRMFSITANFGDAKSIVAHPATTTHQRLTQQQRDAIRLGDGVVRLSIGLEEVAVLREDLARAVKAAA